MEATLTENGDRGPLRVLMSLYSEYYSLLWRGLKRHEFRRRYVRRRATSWYVYLNPPESRLAAVIELGTAIVDSPGALADLANRDGPGTGNAVLKYLADCDHGLAMPIRSVSEYEGLSARELANMVGDFHPPRGYTLIDQHADWARACDRLTASQVVRHRLVLG